MNRFRIGDRWIGDGAPVYVIAEAGSNHNGSFDQAIRLIDAAADAGVDAVKFQSFKAARLYPHDAGESDYLKLAKPIFEIIRELEMPDEWLASLAAHCTRRGVEFLSTPFDEESADRLEPFVRAFKIASYEMTHVPLLRHVARFQKPMIVSTGTATLDEVVEAVSEIEAAGNDQIALLQCTASYPAPLHSINVRAMVTLQNATGRPVGLSDHSREPTIAPVVATALGAAIVEKHFTLSNALDGPDHRFAVEPDELAELVRAVRSAEAAMGHGRKEVMPEERELHAFARRTIFTTRLIRANEQLTPDNVAVLRCGKHEAGLAPSEYPRLLGHLARHDLPAERVIQLSDLV